MRFWSNRPNLSEPTEAPNRQSFSFFRRCLLINVQIGRKRRMTIPLCDNRKILKVKGKEYLGCCPSLRFAHRRHNEHGTETAIPHPSASRFSGISTHNKSHRNRAVTSKEVPLQREGNQEIPHSDSNGHGTIVSCRAASCSFFLSWLDLVLTASCACIRSCLGRPLLVRSSAFVFSSFTK